MKEKPSELALNKFFLAALWLEIDQYTGLADI